MSDDPTPGQTHEPAELQLRKALGTMNDLEPPRDDLFVQRAILRGRAATARRRSALLGAAAALVVVGAAGGTWYAAWHTPSATTASAGSAPEAATDSNAKGSEGQGYGGSAGGSGGGSAPPTNASVPTAPALRDITTWFEPPSTPVTRAFEAIAPTVLASWPDVFSGVYATDATNSHLVVALTRPDAGLEAFVSSSMPAPGDVAFTTAAHSFAEKDALAQQVLRDSDFWRAQGVEILGVRQDARADQVLVLADEGATPGVLVRHYGDLVRAVPTTPAPTGKAPDGSTLPTLQR